MPSVRKTMTACAETGCVDVRREKYLLKNTDRMRYVYIAYVSSGSLFASPLAFRMHRAWSTVVGASGPAKLVAVATESPTGLPSADIVALVRSFSTGDPGIIPTSVDRDSL